MDGYRPYPRPPAARSSAGASTMDGYRPYTRSADAASRRRPATRGNFRSKSGSSHGTKPASDMDGYRPYSSLTVPTASRRWVRDGAGTANSRPQKHTINNFRGDTPPAHFSLKTFSKISTLFPLFLRFLKILSDLKIFSNCKNCKDFYIKLAFSDPIFCLSLKRKGHKGA